MTPSVTFFNRKVEKEYTFKNVGFVNPLCFSYAIYLAL